MNAAIPSAQPTNQGEASSSSSPNTVSGRRVPSRQLLQTALDLAQRAVEMDQGNDVIGALSAYREAVTRLKAVMERVGMEGREGRKGKNGKAEEEGRTLKGIVSLRTILASFSEPTSNRSWKSAYTSARCLCCSSALARVLRKRRGTKSRR